MDEMRARRLRRLWKAFFAASEVVYRAWDDAEERDARNVIVNPHSLKVLHRPTPRLALPPFPDELRGLTCGAKTRKGTPCKRIDLNKGARCKLHGGMSTGPKSSAGMARALENLRKRHSVRASAGARTALIIAAKPQDNTDPTP